MIAFRAYGQTLVIVTSLCYLGHTLMTTDDDWPEIVGKLYKARRTWARPSRVLRSQVADARIPGSFYLSEV